MDEGGVRATKKGHMLCPLEACIRKSRPDTATLFIQEVRILANFGEISI
jgi:hypothetical protein